MGWSEEWMARNRNKVKRGTLVLSRAAGEEGAPTQLGEVRGSRLRSGGCARFPSSPRC